MVEMVRVERLCLEPEGANFYEAANDGNLQKRLLKLFEQYPNWRESETDAYNRFSEALIPTARSLGHTDAKDFSGFVQNMYKAMVAFDAATPEARQRQSWGEVAGEMRTDIREVANYLMQQSRQSFMGAALMASVIAHEPVVGFVDPVDMATEMRRRADPGAALWQKTYTDYFHQHQFQEHYGKHDRQEGAHRWSPKAYHDEKDVLRIGMGTSLQSKEAAKIFYKWGIGNFGAICKGTAEIDYLDAAKLLHHRAAFAAEAAVEKGIAVHPNMQAPDYHTRTAFFEKFHHKAPDLLRAIHRNSVDPQSMAYHAHVEKHASRPGMTHQTSTRIQATLVRTNPAKKIAHAHVVVPGAKRIDLGISESKNAYMNEHVITAALERLDDMPADRGYGDRKNAGARLFYELFHDLCTASEKYSAKPYRCSAGKLTVGIGFNMQRYGAREDFAEVYKNQLAYEVNAQGEAGKCCNRKLNFDSVFRGLQRLTHDQAKEMLFHDASKAEDGIVRKLGKAHYAKLTAGQQMALLDMAYNAPVLIGPKLCRAIRKGDMERAYEIVVDECNKHKFPGLYNRMLARAALWKGTTEVERGERGTEFLIANAVRGKTEVKLQVVTAQDLDQTMLARLGALKGKKVTFYDEDGKKVGTVNKGAWTEAVQDPQPHTAVEGQGFLR